jgi:thymidylate kinase
MSALYFITGSEGVGKSSIICFLKKQFPKKQIHDFDEVGVPENPQLQWRYDTTLHWIRAAINNQIKSRSTIIAGLSFPDEVSKFKEHKKVDKIFFCLLDVHEEEREKRLCKRNASKEVIEDLEQLHQLRRKFKTTKFENKIIDTTNLSVKETADKVIDWIINCEIEK